MPDGIIPIDQVPKDYDPNKVVKLYNPLDKAFKWNYDGKEQRVPKGLSDWTEPLANLLAKHMAEQELLVPIIEHEKEVRGKPFNERNWEVVNEASKGVSAVIAAERAKELVLDPNDKKDAKKIKELAA